MSMAEHLRAQAKSKRRLAEVARRVGPGLSVPADRLVMLQHAQALEAEAVGLDAQADALEAQMASQATAPPVVYQQQQMQQQQSDGEESKPDDRPKDSN